MYMLTTYLFWVSGHSFYSEEGKQAAPKETFVFTRANMKQKQKPRRGGATK